MPKKVKRIIILTAGSVFILLGILGLALPFLQGFLFLAIGLILLSPYSPRLHGWIERYTRRYPKLHATVEKIEAWIVRVIGRP